MLRRLLFSVALLVATATTARAQQAVGAGLVLRGLDGVDHVVTAAELARLPRIDTLVAAHNVEGRYSGVSLIDLLTIVRAPVGDSLRGPALATYVLLQAADGYRVVFSLAEFDRGFSDRVAIVADQKDGKPLAAAEGPYRLIVPGEKRPARWARQVVRIEVRRSP
jgi:hypothetical protein